MAKALIFSSLLFIAVLATPEPWSMAAIALGMAWVLVDDHEMNAHYRRLRASAERGRSTPCFNDPPD